MDRYKTASYGITGIANISEPTDLAAAAGYGPIYELATVEGPRILCGRRSGVASSQVINAADGFHPERSDEIAESITAIAEALAAEIR